jgi:hypothetical protein
MLDIGKLNINWNYNLLSVLCKASGENLPIFNVGYLAKPGEVLDAIAALLPLLFLLRSNPVRQIHRTIHD